MPIRDWRYALPFAVSSLGALASACGGASVGQTQLVASEPRASGASAVSSEPLVQPVDARSAAERLAERLAALPLAGGVLEGLPARVSASLRDAVDKLPAEAREKLRVDAKLAEEHPMLHLFSGGREPVAWCRLGTDSSLSYTWFAAPPGAEPRSTEQPDADAQARAHVRGAARVMERAAAYCLRDFALVLKARGTVAAGGFDVLSEVASVHADPQTASLVFEFLVDAEPSAEGWAKLALWRARELDGAGARTARRRALQKQSGTPASPWVLETVDESIVAAAQSSDANASALVRARALLRLGRAPEARVEMDEAGFTPRQHLGAAGVLARAALADSSCSRLDGGAWRSPFCRATWRSEPALSEALDTLEAAWSTGEGRDAQAVETYLAIAHVLREAVRSAEAVAQGRGSGGAATGVEPMAAAARTTAELTPRLAGIAFYAAVREAISQGLTLAQLQEKTAGVLDPSEPFVQAGWLTIAMAHGARHDVSDLLAQVPLDADRHIAAVAAALRLRNAALHRREDYGEAAADVVGIITSADDPGLVLLLAETEAVASPEAMTRLLALAQRLAEPGNDPVIRLRASLDAATINLRSGRWADVEAGLAPFRDADPRAKFFWTLARFAGGHEDRGALTAALEPLKGATNLDVDWRRWIAAAKTHRKSSARKAPESPSTASASQARLADMSRWASGYRVTSDARIQPEVVFMPHLWPMP